MKICKCGKEIQEKRLQFLIKFKKNIVCLECSSEEKVVGNNIYEGKDSRAIEVISKQQAENIALTYRRKGVSLS